MKKGFTLVELLAVIVILAVILVIAVPQINNVIKETRKNSLGSTAKLIAAKAEEKEVENDALEKTESITCADLVKLDSNYGNCTVTKNASGKWEVTIVGSGKFSGYTCTGTKDNMSCTERDTNTPEYVYSFGQPYYEYTYTVKEGKSEECVTYLENNMKDEMINNWGYTAEQAQSEIEAVCSNSSDIDVAGTNYSASEWFEGEIQYGDFTYEDISSFVERSNPVLVNAEEDYRNLKDSNNNQRAVFLKFKSDLSEKYVCTMYDHTAVDGFGTEPHCLSPGAFHKRNEVDSEWNQIKALFDDVDGSKHICFEALSSNGEGNINCRINDSSLYWECVAVSDDDVFCQYTGSSHALCRIENSGNALCNQ